MSTNGFKQSLPAPDARDGVLPDAIFFRSASRSMKAVEKVIGEIAGTDIPVFLAGEGGSGKTTLATLIHRLSSRRNEELIKLSCATLTTERLREWKSAKLGFLGLTTTQSRGTVLLDEVLETPPAFQNYLVDSLPDGELGDGKTDRPRIVSAAPPQVEEAVRSGKFREVLYYRLKGVLLRIVPLRERPEDVPLLLDFFLRKHAAAMERKIPEVTDSTVTFFLKYQWPGNLRELENVVRAIVAMGDQNVVVESLISESRGAERQNGKSLSVSSGGRVSLKQASKMASLQAERELMEQVLVRTRWNRKRAAEELQISYKALLYKLKQVGLSEAGTMAPLSGYLRK